MAQRALRFDKCNTNQTFPRSKSSNGRLAREAPTPDSPPGRPGSSKSLGFEEDDDDDQYEDAPDHVIYDTSLALLDTIRETEITLNLFLNNKFQLAEERMAGLRHKSMYHALGHSTIVFIKAFMTCEKKDLEHAMNATKEASVVVESRRQKLSIAESLYRLGGSQPRAFTDEELHAELCTSQMHLFRAALTFFADESLTSFVRGAFKIRSCYQNYRECYRLCASANEALLRTPENGARHADVCRHFEAGVLLGYGAFNLGFSVLPTKILKLLEFVGFTGAGAKGAAMELIEMAAGMEGTLYTVMSRMIIICWNLVASFLFGSGRPDLPLCERMMAPLTEAYPNGAVILFLRARLLLVSGDLSQAIAVYKRSIDSQDQYKQFHHACYWELMMAYGFVRQWSRAAHFARLLLEESRWSRATYTYLLAVFIAADPSTDPEKREQAVRSLAQKVDTCRLRIAGKSIPVEKFCARKAARYLRTGSTLFAHYEFMYFWNGFSILALNPTYMAPVLDDIEALWRENGGKADRDDEALYCLLRASALIALGRFGDAERALRRVMALEPELGDHFYLVPNACFELAQLRLEQRRFDEAQEALNRLRLYHGYALENKLQFKTHSLVEQLNNLQHARGEGQRG